MEDEKEAQAFAEEIKEVKADEAEPKKKKKSVGFNLENNQV